MLKKLGALGLLDHEPYRGARLTEAGERVAVEVIRHHRLLELYLAETLGLDVDDVHDEADRLEHVISEELEARIDSALGFPTHDPHGDPIPDANLEWPATEPGARRRVARAAGATPRCNTREAVAAAADTPASRSWTVPPFSCRTVDIDSPLHTTLPRQLHCSADIMPVIIRVSQNLWGQRSWQA